MAVSEGRTTGLLRLGLASVAFFGIALAALHLLNFGSLAEHGRHVSNFAFMAGGWLWEAGLFGLGAGTLLLVAGLRRTLAVDGPAAWGLRALEIAGVGIMAMTVFRTDRFLTPNGNYSVSGYIHDTCAVMSTFFICWAMLLMVAAARVDPAWQGVPGRSWGWPVATITFALAWMGGDVTQFWQIAAFVQRGVVVLMVAWLVTVGWRALALAQGTGSGTPQPVPPPRPTR